MCKCVGGRVCWGILRAGEKDINSLHVSLMGGGGGMWLSGLGCCD